MSVNLLTQPLTQFHSQFISVLDELPPDGKALEITKRVMIVIVAPFAYLALGFLSLVGRLYGSFFGDERVVEPVINITEKMGEIEQVMLTGIINAKTVNEIQSAKLFINVSVNDETFHRDYIIKRIDDSYFDNEFLTQRINAIMTELKEMIQVDNATELCVNWECLIKDRNTDFRIVHGGLGKKIPSSFSDVSRDSGESGWFGDIPSDKAQRIFESLVLKKMGRELVPQLNDQLEFI